MHRNKRVPIAEDRHDNYRGLCTVEEDEMETEMEMEMRRLTNVWSDVDETGCLLASNSSNRVVPPASFSVVRNASEVVYICDVISSEESPSGVVHF